MTQDIPQLVSSLISRFHFISQIGARLLQRLYLRMRSLDFAFPAKTWWS
jgi:hypothetical protein